MKRGASRREVITRLQKFFADQNRPPKQSDCDGISLPKYYIVVGRFGGLGKACKAAGVPFTRAAWSERMPWPEKYFGVKPEAAFARKEDIYE